jgi:hypothetical protein
MGNFFSRLKGNLIPTARVDKNGRVVIRHVKGEGTGTSARKVLFPAPNTQPSVDETTGTSEAVEIFVGMLAIKGGVPESLPRLKKSLGGFSPDTIRRIISVKSIQEQRVLPHVYDELTKMEPREVFVNDLLCISGYLMERGEQIDLAANFINGLQQYEGITPIREDGSYPPERFSQSTCLIRVTQKIADMIIFGQADASSLDFVPNKRLRHLDPRIADKELVGMILTASEGDRERIVDLIEERGIINTVDIKVMLDAGSTSSLSSGVL